MIEIGDWQRKLQNRFMKSLRKRRKKLMSEWQRKPRKMSVRFARIVCFLRQRQQMQMQMQMQTQQLRGMAFMLSVFATTSSTRSVLNLGFVKVSMVVGSLSRAQVVILRSRCQTSLSCSQRRREIDSSDLSTNNCVTNKVSQSARQRTATTVSSRRQMAKESTIAPCARWPGACDAWSLIMLA